MRSNLAMLAVLAGVGLSIAAEAVAESKNLSCITDLSPSERRLLRDCGPLADPPPEPTYTIIQVLPPPPPPIPIKNGEGGKGSGAQRDKDHDAPAGGNDPGPSF